MTKKQYWEKRKIASAESMTDYDTYGIVDGTGKVVASFWGIGYNADTVDKIIMAHNNCFFEDND